MILDGIPDLDGLGRGGTVALYAKFQNTSFNNMGRVGVEAQIFLGSMIFKISDILLWFFQKAVKDYYKCEDIFF